MKNVNIVEVQNTLFDIIMLMYLITSGRVIMPNISRVYGDKL
jgi:hypothetical protein